MSEEKQITTLELRNRFKADDEVISTNPDSEDSNQQEKEDPLKVTIGYFFSFFSIGCMTA